MFQKKKCIFCTKVVHSKFLMLILKPRVSFCIKFALFSNIYLKHKIVKFKWNFLETSYKVYRELPILYFNAPFFLMFLLFRKYLNPKIQNQQSSKQLFTSIFFQDYPQGYIFSYFFKLLKVLSFSRMLVEFSVTCIFNHVWESFFQFMMFTVKTPDKIF